MIVLRGSATAVWKHGRIKWRYPGGSWVGAISLRKVRDLC